MVSTNYRNILKITGGVADKKIANLCLGAPAKEPSSNRSGASEEHPYIHTHTVHPHIILLILECEINTM
jgi:hypothetical protein